MVFYAKSAEDTKKVMDYVTYLYQIPKQTEAQKSREAAMANELAYIKDKIASAVLKAEYQVSFSPIWKDTKAKLRDAGYTVSESFSAISNHLPSFTVSWS